MKDKIASLLSPLVNLKKEEIIDMIEVPKDSKLGDFAFPCFILASKQKKNPVDIAKEIALQFIEVEGFEKIESFGAYINFFVDRVIMVEEVLNNISDQGKKYGYSSAHKGKTIIIEMSSPNIAKPFGIGHLRSTIIGNSLAEIAKFQGYKVIKINYLGDWGTQFGILIAGFKKFGSEKELKKNPINHLLEIYVKSNKSKMEDEGRLWFKKLESGDKEALRLWKKFKSFSLIEFNKLYKMLGIKFDSISGESLYAKMAPEIIKLLKKKKLLKLSEGALIVDLEKHDSGICIIQKSDGATLYSTRDLAAALERHKKYKFESMLYEVGSEQKLYFKQFFKILELLGNKWAKNLSHIDHGLYLDKDGKKFATREGKLVQMNAILNETINLAKKEIQKREKLQKADLEKRALKIALAAIFYGDLKNYRSHDIIFDIERFLSFEGDTGPYLLYTYARAKSVLKKASFKQDNELSLTELKDNEKNLVSLLGDFPNVVENAFKSKAPNIIANYTLHIAQKFNEYYHSEKFIGAENEQFKLLLVSAFAQVLENSLSLLGIQVLEKM